MTSRHMYCVCWLIPFAFLALLSSTAASGPINGTVTSVSGRVQLIGLNGLRRNASVGDTVSSGEGVETGDRGVIQIDTTGLSEITLAPKTRIDLSAKSNRPGVNLTFIKLFKGKIRSKVKKLSPGSSFQVATKTCATGVRGTDFITSATPSGCARSTLLGLVTLESVDLNLLPDELFTDPSIRDLSSLDSNQVLDTGALLGRGDRVEIPAGFYSMVTGDGSPITPLRGLAPGHEELVPEPGSLLLLVFGLSGLAWRYREVHSPDASRGTLGHVTGALHNAPAYPRPGVAFNATLH